MAANFSVHLSLWGCISSLLRQNQDSLLLSPYSIPSRLLCNLKKLAGWPAESYRHTEEGPRLYIISGTWSTRRVGSLFLFYTLLFIFLPPSSSWLSAAFQPLLQLAPCLSCNLIKKNTYINIKKEAQLTFQMRFRRKRRPQCRTCSFSSSRSWGFSLLVIQLRLSPDLSPQSVVRR